MTIAPKIVQWIATIDENTSVLDATKRMTEAFIRSVVVSNSSGIRGYTKDGGLDLADLVTGVKRRTMDGRVGWCRDSQHVVSFYERRQEGGHHDEGRGQNRSAIRRKDRGETTVRKVESLPDLRTRGTSSVVWPLDLRPLPERGTGGGCRPEAQDCKRRRRANLEKGRLVTNRHITEPWPMDAGGHQRHGEGWPTTQAGEAAYIFFESS